MPITIFQQWLCSEIGWISPFELRYLCAKKQKNSGSARGCWWWWVFLVSQLWSLLSAWLARFCTYPPSVRSFNFSQFPVGNALGNRIPGSTKNTRSTMVSLDHIKIIVGNLCGPTPWWFFAQAACRIPRVPMSPLLGELMQAVSAVENAGFPEGNWLCRESWMIDHWRNISNSCFNDISWRCFSIPLIFYWCFMMFHRWYFIDAQFLIYMSLICSWHSPCWSPNGLLYVPFFSGGGFFYKSPNKRGLMRA